jgi:hypothetical protein
MINLGLKVLSLTWMILLVGCGATSTTPPVTVPIRSGPAVTAPAYGNGDQWVYRVVRQTGKDEQIRITYRNGKFEHDNQEIFDGTIWANVYRADSELKPLNFPLTPGNSWSYRYQATDARGRKSWRDAEVKVIGPTAQPIKTAAGQFKAVEIQRFETWGRAERKTTYFYSEDTRSVVKLTGDISSPAAGNQQYDMELIKYSAGR